MNPRVLALVPYYEGSFEDGRRRPNRQSYLESCIESLSGFASRVVVGVQNQRDFDALAALRLPVTVRRIEEPEPLFLPAELCRMASSEDSTEDLVYYTESDQILHIGRTDVRHVVIRDPTVYLAPQRLARVPERLCHLPAVLGSDMHLARTVWHGGVCYGVENETASAPAAPHQELIEMPDPRSAYGAAFLCNRQLFRAVDFTKSRDLPTEHTAGFDLFATPGVRALKTRDALDFHVVHLSGEEFYDRVRPPEREGEPWLVRWSDDVDVLSPGNGTYTVRRASPA